MSNAELIRVDFKLRKVIGRHLLGERISPKVNSFTCNSCQSVYDVAGDIKGIQFAKGFLVCQHCILAACDILGGDK